LFLEKFLYPFTIIPSSDANGAELIPGPHHVHGDLIMRIVVLGAGRVGKRIVEDLVEYYKDIDEVVVGDISLERAEAAAKADPERVKPVKADVTDRESLHNVLKGADAVINATFYGLAMNVINVALELRIPYTDLGSSLYRTSPRFIEAGVPAVIDTGGAPGLINMLSKYLVERMSSVEYIHLYDVTIETKGPNITAPIRWKYSIETMLDEAIMDVIIYRDGEFIKTRPFTGIEERVFPEPIGKARVFHIFHPEVETLAKTFADKGIKEVWYKIDAFSLPWEEGMKWRLLADLGLAETREIDVDGVKVSPRKVLLTLLKNIPDAWEGWEGYEMLQSVAKGVVDGEPVVGEATAIAHITWRSGSTLTACPASITGYWLAKGILDKPGAYPVEQVMDTDMFFKEMARRDVQLLYTFHKYIV